LVIRVAFVAFVALVELVAFVTAVEPIAETISDADATLKLPVPLPYTTPVSVATPVPPRATVRVPVVPPTIGKDVQLVRSPELGVPKAGVTKVGDVANTKDPEPVSFVTAAAKLALVGVSKNVATPVPRPVTPVENGRPVQLVNVPEVGVPKTGVTNVGDVLNTVFPVPVDVVTPVPPEVTGSAAPSVKDEA
jgi:hypothetical protein